MLVEPGDEIAGYRVEALLGVGAFARVYRVHHLDSGSTRALKVLSSVSPRRFQRLQSEWRSQRDLDHPNLVKMHELLSLPDGHGALIMEHVDGVTLRDWLLRNPLPTLGEIEAIVVGVGQGLAAAHAAGVVHRDLKPGNIMLVRGNPRRVKVVDFGYAKLVSGEGAMTRTGSTLGTPTYSSPEQVRDAKRVDSRTDIFSLGCLLYRMCCGVVPFDGVSSLEVFRRIASGEYVPAEERRRGLPDRYYRAIRSALRHDARSRPATVESWLRILDGREHLSEALTRSARELGLADPRWWALVGGVASAVVALGWAGIAIVASLDEGEGSDVPQLAGEVPSACDQAEHDGWVRMKEQVAAGSRVAVLDNTPLRQKPAGAAICLLDARYVVVREVESADDGTPWARVAVSAETKTD